MNAQARIVGLIAALTAQLGLASVSKAQEARVRVVDVGNGLCIVGRTPDGKSFLYDAGDAGPHCLEAVKALVPESKIDVVILSHSDADHIGELPAILKVKGAGVIVYPEDYHRDLTGAIRRQIEAIDGAAGAKVWSLKHRPLKTVASTERTFPLGQGRLTLIAGWYDPEVARLKGEAEYPKAEHNNVVSIVARFEFGGHSVLMTGDTVGRLHAFQEARDCHYAERVMVENQGEWPIDSDILVGQHHGSDNASTSCFIKAVSPTYVVFSAGHKRYYHPSAKVAARYLAAGLSPENMFRTDRGDNEGGGEWIYGAIKGCIDKPGDDDIEFVLPADGSAIRAGYLTDKTGC